MAAIHVDLEHVAVGCNRVVHALHWGECGLLAFGGHNAVIVYDPEEAKVLGTLLGHTDVVTCVRWLPAAAFGGAAAPAALASGSGDGSVRVWLWTPHTPHQPWRLAAVLQAHSAPVTSLTTFPLPGGGLLLVSTAGDGDVAVWECAARGPADAAVAQPAWSLRQRISLVHQIQHCAALTQLPGAPGWLLLALGGVDGGVRLYCAPPGGEFEAVCRLSGHQDWVRGLDFAELDGGKLLLASASQDKNIRVWAVQQQEQQRQGQVQLQGQPPAAQAVALTRYAPKPLIRVGQCSYGASLEALLVGHEDWVHSVAWHPRLPPPGGSGGSSCATTQPACLLSASMDRTMVLWRPDAATGLWMSEESVGDAGANHLGYYTGVFAPGGDGIAAHGFTGALHIWRRDGGGGWAPRHALGGHYGPVVDACWAADGGCLLTVSADQTARMTARLADGHWCEIARPQVHGHDFAAVAALPCAPLPDPDAQDGGGGGGADESGAPPPRYLYASGSEEKVVRVFEAPRAFLTTLASARGAAAPADGGAAAADVALGASLPALGLSNKAVYHEDEAAAGAAGGGGSSGLPGVGADAYGQGPDMAPNSAPSAVAGPPLEEHLAQNTLWPEVHKLYGHGNELYCLAADPRGRYLASACRAQTSDAAAVWLWDARTWTAAGQLAAHTLTVTQLAFSPDGRLLASASRDRSVALFERQSAGAPHPFRLLGRLRAHARIVWGLHWSHDSALLATASRDGKVHVWRVGGAAAADGAPPSLPSAPAATLACGDSVRSVQFAPTPQPDGSQLLAAGLESGSVLLLRLAGGGAGGEEGLACQRVWESAVHERHAAAVRRLCWWRDEEGRQRLASCSDDHAVRVYAVAATG